MLAHPATVTEMLSSAQRNSCVTTKEIQIEFTYQKCSPLNRRLFVHLFWLLSPFKYVYLALYRQMIANDISVHTQKNINFKKGLATVKNCMFL